MTSRAESRIDMNAEKQLQLINADLDAMDLAVTQTAARQDRQEARLDRNTWLLVTSSVGFSAAAIAFAMGFLR